MSLFSTFAYIDYFFVHVSDKELDAPLPTSLNTQGDLKHSYARNRRYIRNWNMHMRIDHSLFWYSYWLERNYLEDHVAPTPLGLPSPQQRLQNHRYTFVLPLLPFLLLLSCRRRSFHIAAAASAKPSSQTAVTVGAVLPLLLLLYHRPCCRQFNFAPSPLLLLLSCCRRSCRLSAAAAKPSQVCDAAVAIAAVFLPYHFQHAAIANQRSPFRLCCCLADVLTLPYRRRKAKLAPPLSLYLLSHCCCHCRLATAVSDILPLPLLPIQVRLWWIAGACF